MATTPHILHVCLDISSTPILTGHARGLADKSSIARQRTALSRYARQRMVGPSHLTSATAYGTPTSPPYTFPARRCQTCETLTRLTTVHIELIQLLSWRRLFALPSTLGLNPPSVC